MCQPYRYYWPYLPETRKKKREQEQEFKGSTLIDRPADLWLRPPINMLLLDVCFFTYFIFFVSSRHGLQATNSHKIYTVSYQNRNPRAGTREAGGWYMAFRTYHARKRRKFSTATPTCSSSENLGINKASFTRTYSTASGVIHCSGASFGQQDNPKTRYRPRLVRYFKTNLSHVQCSVTAQVSTLGQTPRTRCLQWQRIDRSGTFRHHTIR